MNALLLLDATRKRRSPESERAGVTDDVVGRAAQAEGFDEAKRGRGRGCECTHSLERHAEIRLRESRPRQPPAPRRADRERPSSELGRKIAVGKRHPDTVPGSARLPAP